jgi:hypothetical protein
VPLPEKQFDGWRSRHPNPKKMDTKQFRAWVKSLERYAVSCVEACRWVDSYWVGALPAEDRRRISKAHIEALQAGRRQAKAARENVRKRRLRDGYG